MPMKFRGDYLLKGADFLEKNAKNRKGSKFDLNCWGRFEEGGRPELSCGTTACAFGSMAIAKLFPGLSYELSEFQSVIFPKYKGERGFDAAALLFGISHEEANYLFDPSYYYESKRKPITGKKGELRVAKRIRNFVAITQALISLRETEEALKKKKQKIYAIDMDYVEQFGKQ